MWHCIRQEEEERIDVISVTFNDLDSTFGQHILSKLIDQVAGQFILYDSLSSVCMFGCIQYLSLDLDLAYVFLRLPSISSIEFYSAIGISPQLFRVASILCINQFLIVRGTTVVRSH